MDKVTDGGRKRIEYWRHDTNGRKFLEIRLDGHYHWSVRQFILSDSGVQQRTGDKCLHRWTRNNLDVLLKDYHFVSYQIVGIA